MVPYETSGKNYASSQQSQKETETHCPWAHLHLHTYYYVHGDRLQECSKKMQQTASAEGQMRTLCTVK